MEDVSIASSRPPEVDRLEGSTTILLTIRGTRGEQVRDRDTRVKIALSGGQAARLWRLLGERLTDEEKAALSSPVWLPLAAAGCRAIDAQLTRRGALGGRSPGALNFCSAGYRRRKSR
jgi:hypothetical protein